MSPAWARLRGCAVRTGRGPPSRQPRRSSRGPAIAGAAGSASGRSRPASPPAPHGGDHVGPFLPAGCGRPAIPARPDPFRVGRTAHCSSSATGRSSLRRLGNRRPGRRIDRGNEPAPRPSVGACSGVPRLSGFDHLAQVPLGREDLGVSGHARSPPPGRRPEGPGRHHGEPSDPISWEATARSGPRIPIEKTQATPRDGARFDLAAAAGRATAPNQAPLGRTGPQRRPGKAVSCPPSQDWHRSSRPGGDDRVHAPLRRPRRAPRQRNLERTGVTTTTPNCPRRY